MYLGDISPVRCPFGTPELQFGVGSYLFEVLAPLCVERKYVMCGNSDFRVNCDRWEAAWCDASRVQFCRDCTETVIIAGIELQMLFFATVSSTNHCLKDGEVVESCGGFVQDISFVFSGNS